MKTREIALYEYLLNKGDVWTPQVELARDLYKHYGNGECCLAPELFHDTTERHFISDDIASINESADFEKIIISCGKGVKIANETEHEKYLRNQYKAIFQKLKRVRIMEKKCKAHNQLGLDGTVVDAFIEKYENNY